MSLSRLALRLAVIEALSPHALQAAANPVWPTAAEGRVLDSQMTPETFAEQAAQRLPVVAVFTDEAKTEGFGTARDATIDGNERVTLAIEIMVPAAFGKDQDGAYIVPAVALDALTEATLDMLEEQIRERLNEARRSKPLCDILQLIGEIESKPWRDADLDTRLSARRVEFDCEIAARGPWPAAGAAGLDRLPNPLRDVAAALPAESYGAQVATIVAAALGTPAVLTTLAELRLAANMARVAGDAAPPVLDPAAEPPTGDLAGRIPLITP